jgi:hypothetical protein
MAAASCRLRAAAVNEQSSRRRQQLGGECRAEMGSGGGGESWWRGTGRPVSSRHRGFNLYGNTYEAR